MLRSLMFLLVLAWSNCSYGERITILSSSMTYYTQSDTLDIRVTFDQPLDLQDTYLGIWGGSPVGQWPPDTGFSLTTIAGELKGVSIDYSPFTEVDLGLIDYTMEDNTLELLLSFDELRMSSPLFTYEIVTLNAGEWSIVNGVSSVDIIVTHLPEPQAIVSMLVGLFFTTLLVWSKYHGKSFEGLSI